MTTTPDEPATPDELVAATQHLASKVERLARSLTVAEDEARQARATAKRARVLTIAVVFLVGALFIGVVVNYHQARELDNAIGRINANAVTTCQNNNESRNGSLTAWTVFVGLLTAGTTDPDTKTLAAEFLTWLGRVYGPRDCADPTRKYPIPPPPKARG